MRKWYFDLPEFTPKVGFEFQFEAGEGEKKYMHVCEITEMEIHKRLAYSWRYLDVPGISQVTFDLFPTHSGTQLRLTHDGLDTFPKDNPDLATENFAVGWEYIIDVSLRHFLEKGIINFSVQVNAPSVRVWQVLLDPEYINQWANAFSEGTYVETDWAIGSEVLWKDKEHNVGAKGKVVEHDPGLLLKVAYYDEVDGDLNSPVGEYSEAFKLTDDGDFTRLSIEAGPLEKEHFSLHSSLWEKAVMKIKALAEE
jgi:uncharacterized protein YndB with AHSA1/START domain